MTIVRVVMLMVRMMRRWIMRAKNVKTKVSNAKNAVMMVIIVAMTLMKISLIMRMRLMILFMTIMMLGRRMMMMRCLPGWGSERVEGRTVSRAIVVKNLTN